MFGRFVQNQCPPLQPRSPQNSVHWLNERTIATKAMARGPLVGLAASMTSVGAHRRHSGDLNE
jgi:hypothetical protein